MLEIAVKCQGVAFRAFNNTLVRLVSFRLFPIGCAGCHGVSVVSQMDGRLAIGSQLRFNGCAGRLQCFSAKQRKGDDVCGNGGNGEPRYRTLQPEMLKVKEQYSEEKGALTDVDFLN